MFLGVLFLFSFYEFIDNSICMCSGLVAFQIPMHNLFGIPDDHIKFIVYRLTVHIFLVAQNHMCIILILNYCCKKKCVIKFRLGR